VPLIAGKATIGVIAIQSRQTHRFEEEHRRLLTAFEDPEVGGVALSDQALGILISSSHFGHRPHRILSEGEILRALPVLRRFRLVRTFPRFGIQRSPLYLFVPKGS